MSNDFSCFPNLFHMGQSRVCSLIISVKELHHWFRPASLTRLIWTARRMKQIPLKVVHRHEPYPHQQNFLPSAARRPKLLPKVNKTRAQFGTGVLLLYSSKLFEPLFLSMMQLFRLVALFSRFTFVLLSAEDA